MAETKSIAEIELERFKGSLDASNSYRIGIQALKKSTILDLLRRFARPFTVDRGANPYSAAYTAAFSEGYNKCLDDLTYFEEMYLSENLGNRKVAANFGGLGLAVKRGDLTEEERDYLNGRQSTSKHK